MRNENGLTDAGKQLLREILAQSAALAENDPFFGLLEDYSKIALLRSLLETKGDVCCIQKGTSPKNRHWRFWKRDGGLNVSFKASGFEHRA